MINVAIVEDTADFRNLWHEILNYTEGYRCIATFENVKEAVTELPNLAADVVLMDINLPPDGNGIDCVKQLRRLCPNTQFLMFTVFQDDENIFKALKAGAKGYILKKSSPTKVLEAIAELHYENGSPMSPAIARRVLQSFHGSLIDWELTDIEIEILELLDKGLQYKEIAPMIKIKGKDKPLSESMLKQHIHSIYHKLEVSNRTEAVNKYKGQ